MVLCGFSACSWLLSRGGWKEHGSMFPACRGQSLFQTSRSQPPNPTHHVTSPLSARVCAVALAYLTRCHFSAGGFTHLVSKRAWGLLAIEGATQYRAGTQVVCEQVETPEPKLSGSRKQHRALCFICSLFFSACGCSACTLAV